jgi:hypothetical protein
MKKGNDTKSAETNPPDRAGMGPEVVKELLPPDGSHGWSCQIRKSGSGK